MNNVLIDFTAYRFIPLTDEEKQSGIITKLTIDATGVQIDEPQKRVRISNIVFKLREPNPVYLKDYLNVDVIYPDLSGLVDVKQQNVLKKIVFGALYQGTYLQYPEVREKIKFPSNEIIF